MLKKSFLRLRNVDWPENQVASSFSKAFSRISKQGKRVIEGVVLYFPPITQVTFSRKEGRRRRRTPKQLHSMKCKYVRCPWKVKHKRHYKFLMGIWYIKCFDIFFPYLPPLRLIFFPGDLSCGGRAQSPARRQGFGRPPSDFFFVFINQKDAFLGPFPRFLNVIFPYFSFPF